MYRKSRPHFCIFNTLFCSEWIPILLFCNINRILALGAHGESKAYVITSVHNMESLANQELRLLKVLHEHNNTQPEKLSLLNTKIEQLSKVRPPEQTVEEVIGDPMAAYSLIRRLTREWPLVLHFLAHKVGVKDDSQFTLPQLPKDDDLVSAVKGLARLQEVYKLDTKQLTQRMGDDSHLTALDCFEIGKHLFEEHKYKLAVSWFKEALDKQMEQDVKVEEDKILPHLFLATLNSDCENRTNTVGAAELLHKFVLQYPNHTLDKESASLFRQPLSANCTKPKYLEYTAEDYETYKLRVYSETCRGVGVKISPKVKCFYIHHNNPRLLIAPFKMEELHLDPPVLMFHDVISDQEINDMKDVFSRVRGRCMAYTTKVDYRTCDVGWVQDNSTAASARITRRVGDMTNLNMSTSELNQVASYGLSGAYFLHLDAAGNESLPITTPGNRLATLMFYLNDVEAGGFTVFPIMHLAVKPVKGSAVFWFNLDHLGRTLPKSLHGGCPVLRGSKWVLNKWIHEAGQTSDMFCPADKKFPKPRYYMNGIVK